MSVYLKRQKIAPTINAIDLSETTATADDVKVGKEFFNASGEKVTGTYVDGLQQRIDMNGCEYLFYGEKSRGEIINNLLSKIDTSEVKLFGYMFAAKGTGQSTLENVVWFDTSSGISFMYMFQNCDKLIGIPQLDFSKGNSVVYMFNRCKSLKTLPQMNLEKADSTTYMFSECTSLEEVPELNTRLCSRFTYMFSKCTNLKTVKLLNLISASGSNLNNMFQNCTNLTNLKLINIKSNIQIGSGTSWGHLLTLESLLNTIQELWTNTGTRTLTLTMGTANTAKLANVYVKLVTITDEMRAEDEYIDNKAPFVQCESTDAGAMLVTEYVTTVKGWQLA